MNASVLLPISAVIDTLLSKAKTVTDIETIALADGQARVLAEPIIAPIDVPGFDNSAVDGYALRFSDLNEQRTLRQSARIAAGETRVTPLQKNSCVRIFTGAALPPGADTVVMQERCTVSSAHDAITFPKTMALGDNIRRRGQDLNSGVEVLPQGRRLLAQDLGLLASLGIATMKVYRKLRVAIFSTGDEVIEPGQKLLPGQIYNSNRYTMLGLLQQWGIEIVDLGVVEDDLNATQAILLQAASHADCIITSGGVSVGEEDHLRTALTRLGQLDVWRIAIKPGKPFAFGLVNGIPLLGLPGNPAAVLVTLMILAKPFLMRCAGVLDYTLLGRTVASNFALSKPLIREQFLFVRRKYDGNEESLALYPNQSSGILSSSCWATGLARVPINTTVDTGQPIMYYDYSVLFSS